MTDQPAPSLNAIKKQVRREAAAIRARLHAQHAVSAAEGLAETGSLHLGAGEERIIAGYFPIRSEINVLPLMRRLGAAGWVTALPEIVAADRPLRFRLWRPDDPTVHGALGIAAPGGDAPVIKPDVLLVPLLAFDRLGFRLGYGGGFYDRTLAALRREGAVLALGVAFAGQEITMVPRAELDQPLDGILTERSVIAPDLQDRIARGHAADICG